MTTEEGGFDAGKMYDDGVAEAEAQGGLPDSELEPSDNPESEDVGVMTQQTEKTQDTGAAKQKTDEKVEDKVQDEDAVKAALKSAGEDEEPGETEAESIVAALLPKAETQSKTDGKVPLDQVLKLRERAQQAERERDELRQKLEAKSEPKPEVEEISPMEKFVEENPDEDFIPAKIQAEQLKWERQQRQKAADAQAKAEREKAEQTETQRQQIAAVTELGKKADASEKAARKANKDYDEVTKNALALGLVKSSDVQELLKSNDIAGDLYKLSKSRIEAHRKALGIQSPEPEPTKEKAAAKKQEPGQGSDDDLTDDEFFEEVKNENWKAG